MKGQWNVDSVDPVGGNKGVMMKMLTGIYIREALYNKICIDIVISIIICIQALRSSMVIEMR